VRQGFIEDAEYRLLLSRLPEHLKAPFVVGYHCGNRLGEIRKLRPDQVNLEAREIRIQQKQAKGKRDRVIPIYGEMVEWLERQLRDLPQGCQYLFHYRGRPLGSHLKGWSRACADVGLEGLLFHDLRRSAIRNMDRAGVRREVGMAVSGHKRDDVYRSYNIVADSELGEVGGKMAEYRKKQKPKLRRVK
jgi:integrase